MSLNESTGSIISEELAIKYIDAFRKKFGEQVISSFIGSNPINDIMKQEGCIGLRIYNGYNEEKQSIALVLVGVDGEGKDMLKSGLIYDDMLTCPPTCPIEGLFPLK
jgi:hypothetical protein